MEFNMPHEAARIAEMGYPVFPCRDPRGDLAEPGKKGKIPLVSGGVSSATIDLGQVTEWWSKWPTANIGLVCKNCLVIDIDDKDGKNGSEDFERISAELGQPTPTVESVTGSGGKHLFFARPEVKIVGRTCVEWQDKKTGIDIRVGNQYVIAPPSLHESGNRYEWLKPLVPPENLSPLPQSWVDGFLPKRESEIIVPKREATNGSRIIGGEAICDPTARWHSNIVERCRKYVATMPEAVQGKDGHTAILRVANAIFYGFGLSEAEGWPILLEYNMRCSPPWNLGNRDDEKDFRRKMTEGKNNPPPGKEHCWLLNSNREKFKRDDYQVVSGEKNSSDAVSGNSSDESILIAPPLSSYERESLTFLWPNRLLNGKLTLFCGDGSVGKTWFLCYLCAIISRGFLWPDGTPSEQGGVIFFTSEDGMGDTLRPRIEDNGGDPRHIFVPEVVMHPGGIPREFTIRDVEALGNRIELLEKEHGEGYVKLVIFDPITAFMGEIDEFKNNQVRAAFRPMARLADEKKFAWIGVGHPKKGAELGKAKDAFSGSIAYTNAARLVWNFYHDRESGIRRMLLAKNNLLQSPKGLSYIVNDGILSFTDTDIEMDADEYQRQFQKGASSGRGRGRPSVVSEQAIEWLFEYLKDGPKPSGNKKDPQSGTVFGDALENGFKVNTVWRAADELGVRKRQEKFSRRWLWSLDEAEDEDNHEQVAEEYPEFQAFA